MRALGASGAVPAGTAPSRSPLAAPPLGRRRGAALGRPGLEPLDVGLGEAHVGERGDEQRRARAGRRPGVAGRGEGVVDPGQRPPGPRARRWRRASSDPASRGRRGGRTPGAAAPGAPRRGGGARRRPSPPSPCTRRGRSARPAGAGARPRWGRAGAGSRPRSPSGRPAARARRSRRARSRRRRRRAAAGGRTGSGSVGRTAARGAWPPPSLRPSVRRARRGWARGQLRPDRLTGRPSRVVGRDVEASGDRRNVATATRKCRCAAVWGPCPGKCVPKRRIGAVWGSTVYPGRQSAGQDRGAWCRRMTAVPGTSNLRPYGG